MAGPKRPQDRVALPTCGTRSSRRSATSRARPEGRRDRAVRGRGWVAAQRRAPPGERGRRGSIPRGESVVGHGSVVIAAITSCTNTSNPSVMLAAGLLARKAIEAGLDTKPWVKTSLAPGSRVVTDYLDRAGLTPYLDKLGFALVGYGCTTCIGNSGPLIDEVARAVDEHDLNVVAVLVGQPELRGPGASAGACVLPGVAAAVRGVRARGADRPGPHDRTARGGQPTVRCTCATSGRAPTRCARRWRPRSPSAVHDAVRTDLGAVTSTGRGCRRRSGPVVRVGSRLDVRAGAAVLRGAGRRTRPSATSRAHACW